MNQEHYDRLMQSVGAWNMWREKHQDIYPDLNDATLSDANLIHAILSGAYLRRANLSGAYLSHATLGGADLSGASLSGTNLSYVTLSGANLSHTSLSGANFSQAAFSATTFAWVDLSNVKGLETTIHHGPSAVDLNSVTLPRDERTRNFFLRGVGFSDTFIDYLPSLLTHPIQYHSLFLSHSHFDQEFTKRLHDDLQSQGVRCWFAPHDLCPGTPIVRGIEEAIYLHEKFLLILSKDAVISNWVQQEVEAALYKEATTGQVILFPIRLDNTVLESETLWAKRLRQRHIGDFTGWRDETAYQEAFSKLLRHLKVTKP